MHLGVHVGSSCYCPRESRKDHPSFLWIDLSDSMLWGSPQGLQGFREEMCVLREKVRSRSWAWKIFHYTQAQCSNNHRVSRRISQPRRSHQGPAQPLAWDSNWTVSLSSGLSHDGLGDKGEWCGWEKEVCLHFLMCVWCGHMNVGVDVVPLSIFLL